MSEHDEFKYYMDDKGLGDCQLDLKLYMRMVWNHRQDKIDAQAAEIEVLREQLKLFRQYANSVITQQSQYHARLYKLIDENGEETPLLTGDCECPFTMSEDYIEAVHEPIGVCVSCGETAYTRNPDKDDDVLCWACAYDSAN